MIEQATLITGTPESAQQQLREFLESHPNATVLSSSITTSQQLEPVTSDKPNPKSKIQNPKSKIQTTVCIVAGIKL